ncbi:hypothetical protein V3481_015279 [Fusarium oxysporum f. sp. vasinfectum]
MTPMVLKAMSAYQPGEEIVFCFTSTALYGLGRGHTCLADAGPPTSTTRSTPGLLGVKLLASAPPHPAWILYVVEHVVRTKLLETLSLRIRRRRRNDSGSAALANLDSISSKTHVKMRWLIIMIAKMLTPLVLAVRTVSPGLSTRPSSGKRALQAVSAAHGSDAASVKLKFIGARTRPCSGNAPHSRSVPSREPPRELWR